MKNKTLTRWLWLILLASAFPSAAEPLEKPAPVTLAALEAAGAQTLARMKTGSYAWTVRFGLAHGSAFEVEGARAPEAARFLFALEGRGKRFELARVVVKNGLWFVHERDAQGVYRPREAPFALASTYVYWDAAEPRVLTEALAPTLGQLVGVRDGEAVFEAPLSPPARTALRKTLEDARAFARSLPDSPRRRTLLESLAPLERREAHGVETRVDARTGLLTAFDANGKSAVVTRFEWLIHPSEDLFSTGNLRPGPETEAPTLRGAGDLVLISHCGSPTGGEGRDCELGTELVDLRDFRRRRVPFEGTLATPGCFLKGRTRVVVSGFFEGGARLVEVDLVSRKNRVLGGETLRKGFSLFPALSPDGRTLAVLHRNGEEKLGEAQLFLVDVSSGKGHPLGSRVEADFVSWLPDGSGLLVSRKEAEGVAGQRVSRMDLRGHQTPLFEGVHALVLPERRQVLFRAAASREWMLAALDGRGARRLGTGFPDATSPALSPDGGRLLWLREGKDGALEPRALDLRTLEETVLAMPAGRWAFPSWR